MEKNGIKLISKYRCFLMGFAAFYVLIFHTWQISLENAFAPIKYVSYFVLKQGYIGVEIFLFLSGMGLVYSYSKWNGLLNFYKRRILRILPTFFTVCILLGIFNKISPLKFIQQISGWTFLAQDMNETIWYVHAILILYLFFPFYYKLLLQSHNAIAFTCSTIALWFFLSYLSFFRQDAYIFTNRIPIFLIGILIGNIAQNPENLTAPFSTITYISFLSFPALGLYTAYTTRVKGLELLFPQSETCIPSFCMAIGLLFLLPAIMEHLNYSHVRFIRAFGQCINRFFSFLGSFSLEIYCLTLVSYKILWDIFQLNNRSIIPSIWGNLAIAIFTIVASWLLKTFEDYIINKFHSS